MNLPEEFSNSSRQLMGDSLYNIFRDAIDMESPVSIRLNPWKMKNSINPDMDSGQVPWCKEGHYLNHRPNFTFDPLLHAGVYYVQEASSMFLSHILRQHVDCPVRMLDMCAAPGGKSITSITSLPKGSILFCNEPVRTRANILAENLMKLGHPDVVVTQNYPADYRRSGMLFDVILVDAPCSGEGMFRKDKDAIAEWSEKNVENCHRLQREIISDAWECLDSGGLFIYSTCTLNRKEDEDNVAWMEEEFDAELLSVDTEPEWGIIGSLVEGWQKPVYRFLPGLTKGEGMFFAIMRKPGISGRRKAAGDFRAKNGNMKTGNLLSFLLNPEDFKTYESGGMIYAIPSRWYGMLTEAKSLKILNAGICLGCMKGKDFIPSHSLALSICSDLSKFHIIETDHATAIAYLQKSTDLRLPENTPRGIVLLTYEGHPIGFAKHLGNRTNNLYPAEWKIRNTSSNYSQQNIIAQEK